MTRTKCPSCLGLWSASLDEIIRSNQVCVSCRYKSVLFSMNAEVIREPALTPEQVNQEIDEIFTFHPPLSSANILSCQLVETACRNLCKIVSKEVPEGKERTIALNNILSAALFARHGITRRQVVMVAAPQTSETCPPPEVVSEPSVT